jgi:hypothetical protein
MGRDIDEIIGRVEERLPAVKLRQHRAGNPSADDDGIWWFSLPGIEKDVQVGSSHGMCPFTVEQDDMASASQAETARSVEGAVRKVVTFLTGLQGGSR